MKTTQGIARTSSRFGALLMLSCLLGCGGGTTGDGAGSAPAGVRVTADMEVSWNSPNTTLDHNCLQNLAGYRLYVGLAAGVYSVNVPIPVEEASCSSTGQTNSCGAIEACTYTVRGLTGWTGGSWHFAVTAYDSDGNESAYSAEATHVITP